MLVRAQAVGLVGSACTMWAFVDLPAIVGHATGVRVVWGAG